MPAKIVGRPHEAEEESIVISGISGRFSDCLDINTFRRRILAGECLIRHDSSRWPIGLYNLPTGMGKVPQLEDFDADLFGYSDDQADLMDAQDRIMITEAHSALLDAGILPEAIRGTRTGYFWGSFVDQVQSALKDDFEAKGSIFQHHASRIHEALDLKGPACWLENGCATSLTALHLAVTSIRNGLCDQALVGGVNITLDPTKVMWQVDFNTLSHDSTCHVFDEKASGYVKGEGAIVLVVQRRSQAKRVYAEVLGMHCNADGYKADGFTHPGWETQRDLMLAAMRNAGINGADLAYFEAHGTGTQAGDKCELRSIKEAIAVDRTSPLMIGSIKSIAGHAEAASGLVSIAKLIIAYQTKQLAPNIHYVVPNPAIPALTDGTYFVPTEVTHFEGGIVGMNNFGIGGGNASAILNSFPKSRPEDDFKIATASLPRLILLFGRNTKTLTETMAEVETALPKITREYLALLNDISGYRPETGMPSRGYLLVDAQREVIERHLQDVFVGGGEGGSVRRPLWFVFSGLGCQWASMARQMMAVRPFANSIHHCIKYLTSLGYDGALMRRFLLDEAEIEEAAQPIVLSIVVVQVALVDTLRAVNIEPEGIVGHSVGEVAAAYADGCLSREETLQIGLTVEREVFAMRARTPGVMAAVELPYEEALSLRFGTVDVACVNAVDLVTMAGNEADMERLIELLQSRGIFVQRIATNRLTTHSRFLRVSFERTFMPAFERLRIRGRERTDRFLSTSFQEDDWASSELCRRPGATYFGRNMLHVVRFYQAIRHAPRHTLFLEVGPSSQLRSPITRSFATEEDIRYVGLMRRGGSGGKSVVVDNVAHFLTALGQLYTAGQQVQLSCLYPPVEYPVSRHTEFISPIFRYDHSKPRFVTRYPQYYCPSKATRSVYSEEVSLASHPHFADHAVDGLVLYPGTAYLYLAWRAVASWHGAADYLTFPVELRKVNISRATKLSQANATTFKCHYFADTGSFTVEANGNVCASGLIFPLDPKFKFIQPPPVEELKKGNSGEVLLLDSESFYRELHVRGYHFGKAFQNVLQIRDDSSAAVIRWTENVVTYLDAVLQSSVLTQTLRLLYVPTLIEAMQIDPVAIQAGLRSSTEFAGAASLVSDVRLDRSCKLIHAAGVQVLNACFKPIARKVEELGNAELVIESHEAIGYEEADGIDRETRATIKRYLADIERLVEGNTGAGKGRKAAPQLSEAQLKAKNCGLWLAVSRADPVALAAAAAPSGGRRCPLPPSPVFTTELECDLLHSSLTSDRLFRTQLDVVVENINLYNKMNVLEINTSAQLLYPKLVKIIGRPLFSFNMANLLYSIAHPSVDSLPEEITSNHLLSFHPFDVAKSRFPYREMDQQELVIYRDPAVSLDQLSTRVDYDMLLRSVETALAPNGFLLAALRESVHPLEALFTEYRSESFHLLLEQFIKFAEEAGLTYVGRKSDGFTACTVLFRKVDHGEVARQREEVIEISNDRLDWLEVLKAANRNDEVDRIWIHSSDPLSGIVGLTRGLAKDISRNKAKYLFFDRESGMTLEKALRIARRTQLLQNAFIGTKLGSYRHITFCETPELRDDVTDFELRQTKTGDLSSFRPFVKQPLSSLGFEEAPKDKGTQRAYVLGPEGLSKKDPKANQILVEVSKAALNFRDVMIASARMSPADVSDRMAWDDVVLGLEFAGRIAGGQRVMGFANSRAMASSIIANREFLWPVPDDWSLLQAATVSVVYATAYYGLIIRGRLQRGESVLIHAGTGGVGLAAINIALSLGCRLFVTAGTEEKRRFLATTYPAIEAACIGTTRDTSFETMVLQQTGGRGVDVVLNSLTDDMFWATVRCLANNGRFCEIGKYQFMNDDLMDVSHFLRNKTFHGVHLDRLFPDGGHGALLTPKATRERQQIWHLLNEGIASGVVQPLPYTVFPYQELEAAFRYMSTGKHIGKVVVDFGGELERKEGMSGLLPAPSRAVQAIPKSYFQPTKSYIIAGGLGGMGLELMYWMAERGARRFVLTSRSGVKTPTHQLMIKMVKRQLGCSVIVSTEDGGCESGARVVVQQAESLGPIGGIFLSTLVLENESIDKITAAMYQKVMYAKSTQGLVFDRLLRALSYPVDYFVGFSSIAAGRGFAGQTNYAFANSILERICEQRRADGLHGVAVQWGMIGDVGYVADHVDVRDSIRGYKPQAIISCWNFMDRAMQTAHSVVGSFIRVEDSMDNLQLKISLLDHVCNIMGIKEKAKLDPKATLGDLGLDSMMAAEIGNVFENEFHMAMTPQEIRRLTIDKISEGFSTE